MKLLTIALLLTLMASAAKQREWKNGIVQRSSSYASHAIDGDGYHYLLSSQRLSRSPNLTILGPVRFAIEKGVFYLLDDDGREHKLSILRKELLDTYTPAVALPGTNIVTLDQLRQWAKIKNISPEAAAMEFKRYGYTIDVPTGKPK